MSLGYSRNSPKFWGNESAVPGSVYPDHTLTSCIIQFHFNIIQPSLPKFFRFSAHDVFPIMHGHPTVTAHLILIALLTLITPRDEYKKLRPKSRQCDKFPFTSSFLDRTIPPNSDACFQLNAFIYVGILHKKLYINDQETNFPQGSKGKYVNRHVHESDTATWLSKLAMANTLFRGVHSSSL
jgi:hypothetical protein